MSKQAPPRVPHTPKPTLLEIAAMQLDPTYQPPPRPPAPPPVPVAPPATVVSSAKPAAPPAPLSPARPVEPAPSVVSDDERVKDQFRARFRRQLVLSAIILLGLWTSKLGTEGIQSPLVLAGLAALFGGLVLTFLNWRCPRCSRYLYRRLYPSACPRCGVTFHD